MKMKPKKKYVLPIKNMVCNRCIMAVDQTLNDLGFEVVSVNLGTAVVTHDPQSKREIIKKRLEEIGFELIDDKSSKLVENIKTEIINLVHHSQSDLEKINLSDYLPEKLSYNYSYMSKLFSEIEGLTLEKYFILQKIEKAKELLVYDELSLKEIAYRLGYSSVQHLSGQFKKEVGMTPTAFGKLQDKHRKALDEI